MKCAYVRPLFLLLFSLPWLSCAQPKVTGVWILNAIYENGEKIFDRNDPKYTLIALYEASQIWGKKPNKNDSLIAEGLYMRQYRVWYDNETLTFTEDSLFITYGKGDPRHGKDTTVGIYIQRGKKITATLYWNQNTTEPFGQKEYLLQNNRLVEIDRFNNLPIDQTWEFIRRE